MGDDTLYGGSGKDSLNGGAGKDSLNGGAGDDHNLPGAPGCTVDWSALLPWLLAAPGLRSLQTEVHAAVYRLPAQTVVDAFAHSLRSFREARS